MLQKPKINNIFVTTLKTWKYHTDASISLYCPIFLKTNSWAFTGKKSKWRSFLVQNLERNQIRRNHQISHLGCLALPLFEMLSESPIPEKFQLIDLIVILALLLKLLWVSVRRFTQKFFWKVSQANRFNELQPPNRYYLDLVGLAQVKCKLSPSPFQDV